MRWSLDHDADTRSKNDVHWSPLFSPASNGHLEVAQMLLGHGVRIDIANVFCKTSFRQATNNDDVEIIVRPLSQHGVDIIAQDKDW